MNHIASPGVKSNGRTEIGVPPPRAIDRSNGSPKGERTWSDANGQTQVDSRSMISNQFMRMIAEHDSIRMKLLGANPVRIL
jgi:hypothetical protein